MKKQYNQLNVKQIKTNKMSNFRIFKLDINDFEEF